MKYLIGFILIFLIYLLSFKLNKKRKIVINKGFGGMLILSDEVITELVQQGAYGFEENRDDPRLVKMVEKFGNKISHNVSRSNLKIVKIPFNITRWEVYNYTYYDSTGIDPVGEVVYYYTKDGTRKMVQ